ncbi:MAG: hypothetical protein LUD72_04320 [Bacteroidales bacterium]|nr:hypothetical protein [Bacteroidales bacterium]
MKKLLIILLAMASLGLTSCGPAAHFIAEEIHDASRITLTSAKKKHVVVKVDGKSYKIKTSKVKSGQPNPAPSTIKQTSRNTVQVNSGQHNVQVNEKRSGREVYNNRVDVAKDEHRVIGVN